MEKYIIVLGGWALGQLLFIVVQAALVHKSSQYQHTFREALHVYFSKDIGPFFAGLVIMLIVVFVLPEILALANSNDIDNPNHGKYARWVVNNLRISSIAFGVIAQFIGFLIVSKSSKWITKQGGDITINPNEQTPKQ